MGEELAAYAPVRVAGVVFGAVHVAAGIWRARGAGYAWVGEELPLIETVRFYRHFKIIIMWPGDISRA